MPGFECSGGRCAAGEDFCGGVNQIGCPQGEKCVFSGGYYLATGACKKTCSVDFDCGEGMQCLEGYCEPFSEGGCKEDSECGDGFVCRDKTCVTAQGIPCGGTGGAQCPAGFYCLTETHCREGQTCVQLNGSCDASTVPVSLSRYCGRQLGAVASNVSGFAPCQGGGTFRLERAAASRYAFVSQDGTVLRECGDSAPPQDPICARMESECAAGTQVSCASLERQRFIYCPPAGRAAQECPELDAPVCALAKVGSIPALRTPEWIEFGNGCLACNGNNLTRVVEGFWEGGCG
jgi:hypothetical protein